MMISVKRSAVLEKQEVLSFQRILKTREFSEKLSPIVSSIYAFRFLLQIWLNAE